MSKTPVLCLLCSGLLLARSAEEAAPKAPSLKLRPPAKVLAGQPTTLPVATTGKRAGKLLWEASGEARFDGQGRFLAPIPGTYFVRVKSEANPALADLKRVEVVWNPKAPLAVLLPAQVELLPGQSFPFTVEAHGLGQRPATWKASGGTVDAQGVFSADQPGTYTVSVSYGQGVRASAQVRVVPAPAAETKQVVVYTLLERYPKNKEELLAFDASAITHINIAFGVIRDGQVAAQDPARDLGPGGAFAALRELRRRHPHLKLLYSLGGWGATGFSEAAASPESRARFIASALDFMKREELDGLDLDWEYPAFPGTGGRPEDKDNYSALVQGLRQAFDGAAPSVGKRWLLTAATPAGPDQFDCYDWAKVHPHMDFINLMTYDYHGAWDGFTGFNAPINAVRADGHGRPSFSIRHTLAQYLKAGVPKEKLHLGVPFYGRCYRIKEGLAPGAGQASGDAPGAEPLFRNLDQECPAPDWVKGWDAEALEPTLWNPATRVWINYDDEASIRLKAALAVAQELGGVMVWELGQDDGRLLKALTQSMGRK